MDPKCLLTSTDLQTRRARCQHQLSFLSSYPRDVVRAVYATATWPAGCLSVTRRYCINTTKPILKLFRLSGSPIILVSSDTCADTQFQGELHQRGVLNTQGWGKLAIFVRFSTEIAVYLGKSARYADGYYGTLIVMGAGLNGISFDDLE